MHKVLTVILAFIISFGVIVADTSAGPVGTQSFSVNTSFNTSFVKDRAVYKREEGMETKGVLPRIEGYADASLQSVVNAVIDNIYFSKTSAAKENKAKSISFRYSVRIDGTVCSILIFSSVTNASSKEDVSSVNFDFTKGMLVNLTDFFSPVAFKTVNLVISDRIKKNPEYYNQAFAGLTGDAAFYTENGKIVLNFSEGQIAPTTYGIIRFDISLSCFQYFSLTTDNYYTSKQAYSIKMIPLRTICEALGFQLVYTQDKNAIEIRKNAYSTIVYLNGGSQKRFVEAQPENINGVVYVPVSFFDEVPLVAYNVEPSGDIFFATYVQ